MAAGESGSSEKKKEKRWMWWKSYKEDRTSGYDPEYQQHLETEHDTMVIFGYEWSLQKSMLVWLLAAATGGLLLLLFHWWPEWRLMATHKRCPLARATRLLILETYQSKCKTYHIKDVTLVQINSDEQRFSYQNVNNDEGQQGRGGGHSVKIYLEDGSVKEVTNYRMFRSKKTRFVWNEALHKFQHMVGLESATACVDFHSVSGYTKEQQARIRQVYGRNDIEVPVQSIMKLILLEFFNPFYMFQVFSVAVWLAENYFYYCIAIVVMSVFGISTSVIQTRRNQRNLRSTVQSTGTVQVCRDLSTGEVEEVPSEELVPGDLIVIPARGCTMHVDAVLLHGSCIVNESMLTGESVPVTKTAIPRQSQLYSLKEDSSHTLYCGTKVIQTRYYSNESVKAVVLRTGFLTAKGQLVRSIMYPLPADFKFDRDSYKFIIILTILAILGLIYTVALKAGRNVSVADVIIKSLDILTIVVPPALPAAMTLGRLYAISRLRKKDVFCINPRVINVCGSINCVCFDKTGTLTEDGLDMWGVIPVKMAKKSQKVTRKHHRKMSILSNEIGIHPDYMDGGEGLRRRRDSEINVDHLVHGDRRDLGSDEVTLGEPVKDPKTLSDDDLMKIGMNVCHSLTILDDQLTGDPLDVKMFESTGWILEEPTVPDTSKFDLLVPTLVKPPPVNGTTHSSAASSHEWGVVHQYQFSSSLQRSGVVCRALTSPHYMVFCKGSPEMIAALSLPETVPIDLKSSLRHYTRQGYRVLAMAYRYLEEDGILKIQRLPRAEAECHLTFLGLVILENRLKPQTQAVIDELIGADVKIVMITGDNLDTAVSVATECGILRHGDRLVMCEAVPSEHKGEPPSLYYTHTLISVQGLKQSYPDPANLPQATKVNFNSELWPPMPFSSSASSFPGGEELGASSSSLGSGNSSNSNGGKVRVVMNGTTWGLIREHHSELLQRMVMCGAVFARMSSDQKQALVQDLQGLGYYVAMCGDGANDCGALKAAHAGISVSGQESSVASPFTSREGHVGCVPLIIREGRAALTTSFGMFKFMVAYSLTEFLSVAFLYYFDSNLTDFQFLYIDIALSINFAFFFGKTQAYPGKLCSIPPPMSLLGFVPLFSLLTQLLVITAFQVGVYEVLKTYPWYVVHTYQGDIAYLSYENYAIFCLSMFQYITLAIAFSHGAPYRRSIFTNYVFLVSLFVMSAIGVYIVVYPAEWLSRLLELKMPPEYGFRIIVLAMSFGNFVVSLIVEKFVVEYLMQSKKLLPGSLRENIGHITSHRNVEREIANDQWPPVSATHSDNNAVVNMVSETITKNGAAKITGSINGDTGRMG